MRAFVVHVTAGGSVATGSKSAPFQMPMALPCHAMYPPR